MTSRDFCYWLQGLFELSEAKELGAEQTSKVRAHLAMVFKHEIDPSAGTPEHQIELQALHDRVDAVEKEAARPKFDPMTTRLRC